jgi:hypothetical protein
MTATRHTGFLGLVIQLQQLREHTASIILWGWDTVNAIVVPVVQLFKLSILSGTMLMLLAFLGPLLRRGTEAVRVSSYKLESFIPKVLVVRLILFIVSLQRCPAVSVLGGTQVLQWDAVVVRHQRSLASGRLGGRVDRVPEAGGWGVSSHLGGDLLGTLLCSGGSSLRLGVELRGVDMSNRSHRICRVSAENRRSWFRYRSFSVFLDRGRDIGNDWGLRSGGIAVESYAALFLLCFRRW